MKFYLAHPISMRKKIRKWELQFEEQTNIELINPFYDKNPDDPEAKIINKIDKGLTKPNTIKNKEKAIKIMTYDLDKIKNSDGIIAFIEPKKESFGTPMEVFYNSYILKKPTYIITKLKGHPWILSLATKIFKNKEEFTKWTQIK